MPNAYQPEELLNRLLGRTRFDDNRITVNVRGVGVIVFLVFTIIVGWLAKGLIGRSLIRWAEGVVETLPVVRSVYNGLKQIAETVFAQSETSFDKAYLVEYPRKGLYTLTFQTATEVGEIQARTGEDVIACFVPSTPNPTTGYIIMVPRQDVIELDMTVEEAIKFVMSLGVVVPRWNKEQTRELPLKMPTD